MKNRYRDMFDQVRASDTLRQEVLQMREQNRNARRRLPMGGLVAAALAVVLLAVNMLERRDRQSRRGGR